MGPAPDKALNAMSGAGTMPCAKGQTLRETGTESRGSLNLSSMFSHKKTAGLPTAASSMRQLRSHHSSLRAHSLKGKVVHGI